MQWFAAIHTGLTAATYWCLLVNGFVGFQMVEDGTPLSLWVRRSFLDTPASCFRSLRPVQTLQGTSAVVGAIVGLVAIGTFKNSAGLSSAKPTGLWILQLIFPLACVVVYIVAQFFLVLRTLDDRWPIGDILFGTAFWVIAQVLLFAFSNTICDAVSHYLDGTFFHALCNLFAVMMSESLEFLRFEAGEHKLTLSPSAAYKYWDSLTKEECVPSPSHPPSSCLTLT